jgi:hypothetical protein
VEERRREEIGGVEERRRGEGGEGEIMCCS